MRVSQLRLSGFKSFVETLELPVEDGLTGIVGPNGCGKSNLLDALCWVMGEASFRNMRGKNMEDVIFSGTAMRPPHNHAEATLVIDNSDHSAREPWSNVDSIEVTRRIERDSGSGYSINGQPILAREARVLFANIIGGAHSPFLVHQGRITQLISASPAERRMLLDQAAGIGGLRARRHEAELQLNAARANLERLNDGLEEMQNHLENLKRQERQAKRYRSLAQRIRATEALLLHARWQDARSEAESHRQALIRAEENQRNASRAATQAGAALQKADADLNALRVEEAAGSAALNRIRNEREILDAREKQLQQRQESLHTRLEQTGRDLQHEAARLQDFQATKERLEQERQRLMTARPHAAERLRSAKESESAAQQQLAGMESALEALLALEARNRARRDEVEREAERQRERAELLAARMSEIIQTREGLQQEGRDDAASESPAQISEQRLESLRQSEKQAEQALEAARHEEFVTRQALEEQQREHKRMEAEIAALKEWFGAGGDGGAAVFPGILHELSVQSSYETALGASLGADLDASLDAAAPVCWKPLPPFDPAPALPAGVRPLQQHIGAPEALARRLSQIGVVDRQQGDALQKRLLPGQTLVSIEGDVWRWDGFHASAEAAAGVMTEKLTRRNLARELETRLAAVGDALPALQKRHAAAQEKLRMAMTEENDARMQRRRSEAGFFAARENALRARQQSQARAARLEALAETLQRLQEEQAEAEYLQDKARKELSAFGAEASAGETDATAAQRQIDEMRAQLHEARETFSRESAGIQALQRDIAGQDARMDEIGVELTSWEERIAAISAQTDALSQRRQETQEEIAALQNEPEEIAASRTALLQQMQGAEERHRQARDALAVGEKHRSECAKKESTARENASAIREERARCDALLENARQRLDETWHAMAQHIRREAGCEPETADVPSAPDTPAEEEEVLESIAKIAHEGGKQSARNNAAGAISEESPDILEERLRRLQGERERLGSVNLRAEQDAEETRTRLHGIQSEQEDLLGAIARLRQAIARLNREGRERLEQAFNEVNQHFGELFTRLFGGGTAHLRLLEDTEDKGAGGDSDSGAGKQKSKGGDMLESGLEIMARPPGKRLQSLSLLSGGEQTLTALALIFAVFLTNAPPICVLDEADAPLDDINVERFCRLVRDVCDNSGARILLITHHPLTMARMDRLFGVTMQERGVSRLVSVDLQADGGLRETDGTQIIAAV